jgi:hypothetical protein
MLSPLSHCVAVVFALGLAIFGFAETVQAQDGPCDCPDWNDRPVKEITDNDGAGIGTVTWSCDTVYILTEPVFVNPGDILTIAPGTLVKGRSGIVFDTLTYTLPNGNPSPREDYLYSQHAGSLIVRRRKLPLCRRNGLTVQLSSRLEPIQWNGSVGYECTWTVGGIDRLWKWRINPLMGMTKLKASWTTRDQNQAPFMVAMIQGMRLRGFSAFIMFSVMHRHHCGISQFENGMEPMPCRFAVLAMARC